MQEEARVVVGVPHVGDLPGYFVDSLCEVLASPPHHFVLQRVERRPTDVARNEIARSFLAIPGATHLFFMDSDMAFPREAVTRLLSRGLPIVSGLYVARTELPVPHVYHYDHLGDDGGHWYRTDVQALARWMARHPESHAMSKAAVYADTPDSLVECDAVGAGCLLIAREVLERMEPPWFKFDTASGYGGEDFWFCRKAKELGYPIVADLSVHCGHMFSSHVGAIDFSDAFGLDNPETAVNLDDPLLVHHGPFGDEVFYGSRGAEQFTFPEDVEGYTTRDKCLLLYRLARRTPADEAVVELGVYKGRSLISLAQGHEAIGVDHFEGEPVGALDAPQDAFADHVAGNYFNDLSVNLARYSANARVLAMTAQEAAKGWDGPPVGLLVHDAGHGYEDVRADIDAWLPKLAHDATLVFDDANFVGVRRVVSELGQAGWQFNESASSMLALKRKVDA